MEDVDYDKLIKLAETSVRKSYMAYEIGGRLTPNVANLGGKKGEIAKLERSGEYYGLAVELLEDLRPILTDRFVTRILTMLKKEDYITPVEILKLTSVDQLHYILHTWFERAVEGYDNQLSEYKNVYPVFVTWINSVTHDPLLGKIKVVEIGQNQNTGQSVVPSEWLDREFENGRAMHAAMSNLESRIGKSPVTYAIIYSMIIQRSDILVENPKASMFDVIFYLDLKPTGELTSSCMTKKNHKIWKFRTDKQYQYVAYKTTGIGFILTDILEPKGKIAGEHTQSKLREVGLLVSRLQKAIRRGRYGSRALIETIDALNESPNYNLPEHGFLRVSASKQLAWRLYITIMEDCRPYQNIHEADLLELMLLVLITQRVQEYKFTKPVLNSIKMTAVLAQYNDRTSDWYDWRANTQTPETEMIIKCDSVFHDSIYLAINNVIMMSGDREMLAKLYSETQFFEPFIVPPGLTLKTLPDLTQIDHNKDVYDDIILSSFDPHCKTCIILYYQACIPISLTTKQISGYIWNISSSYNVRSGQPHPKIDNVLRDLQKYFLKESQGKIKSDVEKTSIKPKYIIQEKKPNSRVSRIAFLTLFGKKYRIASREIIIAGTPTEPLRIKTEGEWQYSADAKLLAAYPARQFDLSAIDPPFGYKWKYDKVKTQIIKGRPYINDMKVDFFDGSMVLSSIKPTAKSIAECPSDLYKSIIQVLSGTDVAFEDILKWRKRNSGLPTLYDWMPDKTDVKSIDTELVKLVYTKIFNQLNNIIMIGPVTRTGHKMQNSINYQLEGKLWAVFCLFCHMYPDTFKPHGSVNFYIKKMTTGYVHLIGVLESILFVPKKISGPIPTITTSLWDHQLNSVKRITAAFHSGLYGYGDASDVGSGKTLTSLKIAAELIAVNDSIYSGILVMLPGNMLIETWQSEIAKHTQGFDVVFQKNEPVKQPIKRNTIVVTTMGRMRDHPMNHNWLLLVIDECLTVQNKNALWTEEAWKQSMTSRYLVMMSATFFRTRFDKLYYMLKMLRTGLPESRDYLETILLESIVSQVSAIRRKWTSTFHRFDLETTTMARYQDIHQSDLSLELKFAKLTSFLVKDKAVNESVVSQLGKLVRTLTKNGSRCLIYARASDEAELWSKRLKIPIYPKKGTHCIVTYHDGTYGLNDLVVYNTIVMRPPPPDKLPQIKGRLDRPGQKQDNLNLEYFIIRDTIEEGLILRLDIASNFLQKYIMPLAKFYDVSVNYKDYK